MVGARGRAAGRSVLQLDARRALVRGEVRVRRRVHERTSPERLRLHAEPELDGERSGTGDERHERRHRADGRDPADLQPAAPRRRGVRDARLHQRWSAGGRPAPRQPDGREPLLRHYPDGAPRALPRGRRAHPEGLAGARDLLVERAVLPARDGEPLAAADPRAASPGVDPGVRQHQHLRLRRGARRLLLLPQLLGRPIGEDDDGRLLARGGREGARPQSLSRGLPAAGGRRRERCARRGEVRAARRVLLPQVPARAGHVVLAAR